MTAAPLAPYAKPSHAKAARAVCDTLTMGGVDAFGGLSLILRAKLSPLERRALAWAALRACDDEEAVDVAEAVIPPQSRAGWPVVPLEDVAEEAAFWADYASPDELRAYALGCFNAMPATDRAAFLSAVTRRAAA